MPRSDTYTDDTYVALGPGAQLLGVHPGTLRAWGDEGRVPVYRTPTNQRRYRVGDLHQLMRREVPDDAPPTDDDVPANEPTAASA